MSTWHGCDECCSDYGLQSLFLTAWLILFTSLTVARVCMQTPRLAGPETQLCALCPGERCPQRHVCPQCGRQRPQQHQAGTDYIVVVCFFVCVCDVEHGKELPIWLCSCDRVQSAIEEVASETKPDQKAASKVRRKARGFLQEMVANISPSLIRFVYVLQKINPSGIIAVWLRYKPFAESFVWFITFWIVKLI